MRKRRATDALEAGSAVPQAGRDKAPGPAIPAASSKGKSPPCALQKSCQSQEFSGLLDFKFL